ncbi:hypothetical protein K474DRAFT_1297245 [Panus rudis PR-1116 ss-1]|nr:hypothetical protein K474DRAFT_1297245 [Panus rudis PR-1116 ss-1]
MTVRGNEMRAVWCCLFGKDIDTDSKPRLTMEVPRLKNAKKLVINIGNLGKSRRPPVRQFEGASSTNQESRTREEKSKRWRDEILHFQHPSQLWASIAPFIVQTLQDLRFGERKFRARVFCSLAVWILHVKILNSGLRVCSYVSTGKRSRNSR